MRVAAETKKATRQRILKEAKKLFARDGFEATTTRDIAVAAEIAAGTLFNYFATKESIVECLVTEACGDAEEALASSDQKVIEEAESLDAALFAHVARQLRAMKPYRKYLPAVLETSMSPLAVNANVGAAEGRTIHLETVERIVSRFGLSEALTSVGLQLYWTLYTGVLSFWSKDASPRQEDTLALLDESMAMFVGWLAPERSNDIRGKKE
jgi:AcrR family transcriptional regulator